MKRIRTFVAIDLDDPVRRAVGQLVRQLANALPAETPIHWVANESMHVTVKFLGEVEESELYRVCQAVEASCLGCRPLELECAGVGAFPRVDRARTIWLDLQGPGRSSLQTLHGQMESSLAELGFLREIRPFAPHVTLGRVRGRVDFAVLASILGRHADSAVGRWEAQEVVIYASRLSRGGPTYMPLGRVNLDG